MAASEDAFASLVNRRSLPAILLSLAAFLVVISFFVGWFSVDATVERYEYDSSQSDYHGAKLPPNFIFDLEMKMLSLETTAKPRAIEDLIDSRGGKPTYDQHASNTGTVMLGVLMLELSVFVCLLALASFYFLNRRNPLAPFAPIVKRLFALFLILVVITLVYFSVRIGPAAQQDERIIINYYPLDDRATIPDLEPRIGFWNTWIKPIHPVPIQGQNQAWVVTIQSKPSAGFWLEIGSVVLSSAGIVLAQRNGEFRPRGAPVPVPTVLNAPV